MSAQSEPAPARLQVTRLVIRRLWNLGDFENYAIEAEALVAADDDPSDTLAALQAWVELHGPQRDRYGRRVVPSGTSREDEP